MASIEWNRRVAVRLRYFAVDIGDRTSTFGPFTIHDTGRRGALLLGEVLYEFRPRSKIQPFVGASAGRRSFETVTRCEPVSCAEARATPGGPGVYVGGRLRSSRFTLGGIAGVSMRPANRVTIQAMIGVHDPATEHGETVEGAVLVSVAVWRSR
ncbi:MAG: hypothetical protein R2752_03870 [Vicinamibacterales bacterium]